MRRYAVVVVLGMLGVVVASMLSRMPLRHDVAPEAPLPVAARTVAVDIYPDRVATVPTMLPVGSTVALTVRNHRLSPVQLALSGYEDRVNAATLAPDTTWRVTFLADRPGEQFAWLVNREPQWRFDVQGNHLVKGHR